MAKKKMKVKKVVAKTKRPAKRAKSRVKAAKSTKRMASKKSAVKLKPAAVSTRPKWLPAGTNPISPILILKDVGAAMDFYQNAFGFKLRNVMKGPDDSILHAEMSHHESMIMMGPESPERGAFAPTGPSPVRLYIFVADVDAVTDLARLHGAKVIQPPTDMFWGDRCALVVDAEGHSWIIATHVKDIPFDEMVPPPPDQTIN